MHGVADIVEEILTVSGYCWTKRNIGWIVDYQQWPLSLLNLPVNDYNEVTPRWLPQISLSSASNVPKLIRTAAISFNLHRKRHLLVNVSNLNAQRFDLQTF